ncbi:host attachment protein [Phenylobacterium sp.]|uniref:host attachment protein n=1 Tax=Phenylobacterium sp. TaxID=1871053 RepID=UPI0025CEAFC8|nr:host attachment protein [Phenylobacterium sp.]MBX3485852.1 host attachment protein [Phenylobacterium sp.]
MDQGGVTWIVTADGRDARIFCERARTGPLQELPRLRMTATDRERSAGARHGHDERAPQHEPERRFLRRVAGRVALEARRGEFERLVLMGPPRALGFLKTALPPEVAARVDVVDPHARRHDDPDTLRQHLRQARARTWA